MFLHSFQKSTLDASSKGEGSDIYIYLSLVVFQAFWITFFMAGTRQWLVPEMYFVHVQVASVHQPFQCCKFSFLMLFNWLPNYLCSMQPVFLASEVETLFLM